MCGVSRVSAYLPNERHVDSGNLQSLSYGDCFMLRCCDRAECARAMLAGMVRETTVFLLITWYAMTMLRALFPEELIQDFTETRTE